MAKLKLGPLENLDGVDDKYHGLYQKDESDGKYYCVELEYGPKQIKALKEEAGGYRIKLKDATTKLEEANTKLGVWGDLDPDKTKTALGRIEELETSAKGKVPEEKLNELAQQRAVALAAPLNAKIKQLETDLGNATKLNGEYKQREDTQLILNAVREHAGTVGFSDGSFRTPDDALCLIATRIFTVDNGQVVARDGSGFTPGLPPKEVLPELLEKHPYLSKMSQGGGSTGSLGANGQVVGNVFKGNDKGLRAKLMETNPKEFERQFQASGLKSPWDDVKPGKSA